MAGIRWGLTLLALAIVARTSNAEEPRTLIRWCTPPSSTGPAVYSPAGIAIRTITAQPATEDPICAIYPLDEFGDDTGLARWVAETIPQVIEPGSWNCAGPSGKKQVLCYYAPRKILVIHHTPAVQARVVAFLKNVKKLVPDEKDSNAIAGKMPVKDPGVVRAGYQAPAPPPPAATPGAAYPIPAPAYPPKHLIHFIIRYEGAGIIDDNVVKFAKAVKDEKSADAESAVPQALRPLVGAMSPKDSGTETVETPKPVTEAKSTVKDSEEKKETEESKPMPAADDDKE